jgi:hypothetical protein
MTSVHHGCRPLRRKLVNHLDSYPGVASDDLQIQVEVVQQLKADERGAERVHVSSGAEMVFTQRSSSCMTFPLDVIGLLVVNTMERRRRWRSLTTWKSMFAACR